MAGMRRPYPGLHGYPVQEEVNWQETNWHPGYPVKEEKIFRHPAPDLEDERDRKRIKLRVVLNAGDCNLDFNTYHDGLVGSALHERGFGYCWSGARANIGIRGGRYCFGCRITGLQEVDTPDTAADQKHLCRLGISRGDSDVGCLGESKYSFGYGGSAKFSTGGSFRDYGERFGLGDLIICCVDLESWPSAKIGFMKNGKWLGIAKEFDAGSLGFAVVGGYPGEELPWNRAIFPHVLLKNVIVQMQFSLHDGLIPAPGFKPWDAALEDGNGIEGPKLGRKGDCEVLMMVGLPASGKTTWAEHWSQTHLDKRYIIIGTNLALEQMKVPGLLRKKNYAQRWEQLMSRATEIFNALLDRASDMPRNYIIDQTNVYISARRRKMRSFAGFHKIAVVVVANPEEHGRRTKSRAKDLGKEVPVEAVNEMKANFVLPKSKDTPGSDEPFDEVWFVELQRAEADLIVQRDKNNLIPGKSGTQGEMQRERSNLGKSGTQSEIQREMSSLNPGKLGPQSEKHAAKPSNYLESSYAVGPGRSLLQSSRLHPEVPPEQWREFEELTRASSIRGPGGATHQHLPLEQGYSLSRPAPDISASRGTYLDALEMNGSRGALVSAHDNPLHENGLRGTYLPGTDMGVSRATYLSTHENGLRSTHLPHADLVGPYGTFLSPPEMSGSRGTFLHASDVSGSRSNYHSIPDGHGSRGTMRPTHDMIGTRGMLLPEEDMNGSRGSLLFASEINGLRGTVLPGPDMNGVRGGAGAYLPTQSGIPLPSYDAKGLVTGIPLSNYETMQPATGIPLSAYSGNLVSPTDGIPISAQETLIPNVRYSSSLSPLTGLPSSSSNLGSGRWSGAGNLPPLLPSPVTGFVPPMGFNGPPHPYSLPLSHSFSPELREALISPELRGALAPVTHHRDGRPRY